MNYTNRPKRARSSRMVLSGFWRHEIFMDMSEQMKRSRLCLPASCGSGLHSSFLICAQDLWMSLSAHVAAVIIQLTACGWRRGLVWSEVRGPPGPRVQSRRRGRRQDERQKGRRERTARTKMEYFHLIFTVSAPSPWWHAASLPDWSRAQWMTGAKVTAGQW